MNSYERIMRAMNIEETDIVPLSEFVIDKKVINALLPEAKFQNDFEEFFNLDTVCCQNAYLKISESGDSFTDEWGVLYKKNSEHVLLPIKGPIESFNDLKKFKPPDPDRSERLGRLPELVKKYKGQKAIIFHQREAFLWSTYLVGMENLLTYFIEEPEFAKELLDKVLDANIRLARNAIREGADIIVLSDDYAFNNGPLFSPEIFDEFLVPGLKKIVNAIHEEGAKVIKHSDGNLSKILDSIISTGIDALNPIDPLAGMDIGEIKRKYGHRVCLWGNIDCSNLLSFGTTDEVRYEVRKCIAKAAPGGGFVLTSSNSIHSSVNPVNYKTMIECRREYGMYPIMYTINDY